MGQIVTFYSYKGGVGRTMALANVAVLLSQWGYRVLMIDWDLEAPGLENYFKDFIPIKSLALEEGVIDLLDTSSCKKSDKTLDWRQLLVNIKLHEIESSLYLLTAGRRENGYFQKVRNLDVTRFYTEEDGGAFIEKLRKEWKDEFDFVLIDSRTGITDIGGICTVHLPDMLVVLFTATHQGFYGALDVVSKANAARQRLPFDRLDLATIPIPSRFDTLTEFKISQEWLDIFEQELKEIYANWLPTSVKKREMLENTKIPYVSYFSFGEKLPVIEHGTSDPTGLGYAYENLAALISHNLESVEVLIEDREAFIRAAGEKKRRRKKSLLVVYDFVDSDWNEKLLKHIKAANLEKETLLWDVRKLKKKFGWETEIINMLESAGAVLFLLSVDFFASGFTHSDDVNRKLLSFTKSGLPIFPLIVRPCNWELVEWLEKARVYPETGIALSELTKSKREKELAGVLKEIVHSFSQADKMSEIYQEALT